MVNPSGAVASPATSEPDKALPDEKLLERALEDQESARNAFLRDLKLALLLILAFQWLILVRFVRLSDATRNNGSQVETLKVQENATHELQTALQSLQLALRRGADLTSKRLAEMPKSA